MFLYGNSTAADVVAAVAAAAAAAATAAGAAAAASVMAVIVTHWFRGTRHSHLSSRHFPDKTYYPTFVVRIIIDINVYSITNPRQSMTT